MTDTLIIDVCGTLVRENTTFGFVRTASLRAPMRVAAQLLLSRLGGRGARFFGHGAQRTAVVACLSGCSRMQLESDAARYARAALSGAGRSSVLEKIQRARDTGKRVFLASASLDVVVQAFAGAVQADGWIASRLAFDANDTCRGLLSEDATGRKLELLQRRWGQLGRFEVVTDNPEDTDLMRAAVRTHFIRVVHA